MASSDQPTPSSSPGFPPLDEEVAKAVHALGPEAWWAIDIVPLLKPQESDPLARFAVLLVMAHDVVVYTEFSNHPGADHAASLIVHALRAAAHKAGVWPERLLVRGEGLDLTVQDAIDDAGGIPEIVVYGVARFGDYDHPAGEAVDQAILNLRHHMDGVMIPDVPASSSPLWAAWGVALDHIEAFFNATAELYRAIMMRRFAGSEEKRGVASQEEAPLPRGRREDEGGALLVIEEPDMLDSLAVLFGERDTLSTIMLFADREDWDAMVEAGATDPVSADVRYPVSCISFVPQEDLWGGLAEEVTTHQWTIAHPSAYPTLWILNADGGGMTTTYCQLITRQIEAIARAITFGASEPLHAESVFQYVDAPTGFVIRTALDE